MGSEQELAQAKEGIGFAPAMAEHLVLYSSADLVEHPLGHSGDVERISYPPRVGEARRKARLDGSRSDRALPPAPPGRHLRAARRPWSQLCGALAFDEVDHDAPVQIGQMRGMNDGVRGFGPQMGVLIRARGAHPEGPSTKDVPWSSTAAGGVPAHPVLGGYRGDGREELANLPGHLGAGAGST